MEISETRCRSIIEQTPGSLKTALGEGRSLSRIALHVRIHSMNLDRVPAGRNVPDDFNVIIEIPAHADPIKYEVDKETGAVFVDRFIGTSMHYPCNYGYVPKSLADDGDPLDVLVVTPFPLQPGVVVRCRPLGVLKMEDEAGGDSKLLAVPGDKVLPWYKHWQQW